jgi:hypothetical protein
MVRQRLDDLANEYVGARFGDARLTRRLVSFARALGHDPAASFPVTSDSDAEQEGTYRFLGNERVTPGQITAPHMRATVGRIGGLPVVVPHDTTEFNFAVSLSTRDPLGVLGVSIHERHGGKGRRGHQALQSADDNEFLRWKELVVDVEKTLGAGKAIHVMDREADSYALMAELCELSARFVVRMAGDKRALEGKPSRKVGETLSMQPVLAEREVALTARGRSKLPGYDKRHPERRARMAQLEISGVQVTLLRPESSSHSPAKTLTLNAVKVVEPKPPEGEPAVEWRLWTREPIDTPEQILAVVDAYRCRWVIEEYFKALKTGCAIEKRQLESMHSLLNALAVFVPIAWRLLRMRTLSRTEEAPASLVLSPVMITCLRMALRKRGRPPLPPKPMVRDALLGVAGLGGHIKNNGDPGWIVLGRGFDKLLDLVEGCEMSRESRRSDQS